MCNLINIHTYIRTHCHDVQVLQKTRAQNKILRSNLESEFERERSGSSIMKEGKSGVAAITVLVTRMRIATSRWKSQELRQNGVSFTTAVAHSNEQYYEQQTKWRQ